VQRSPGPAQAGIEEQLGRRLVAQASMRELGRAAAIIGSKQLRTSDSGVRNPALAAPMPEIKASIAAKNPVARQARPRLALLPRRT